MSDNQSHRKNIVGVCLILIVIFAGIVAAQKSFINPSSKNAKTFNPTSNFKKILSVNTFFHSQIFQE